MKTIILLVVLAAACSPEQTGVVLYFSDDQATALVGETRAIGADDVYYNSIQALIDGPEHESLAATMPPATRLLGVTVEDAVATVNLSRAFVTNHWGGSSGEMLTVYSIVNTLGALDGIDAVQILVEGETIETLAGHLMLDAPLQPSRALIQQP